MCCERIISVHINWCRFFILLLIIYSGFHTEPWAVIFSDNAWQRQQNILKKLTKQPACTTTSFNSNSKSDSLCSWKVAFFFDSRISSFLLLCCTSTLCWKDFISIQMLCSCTCKYIYFIYPNAQSIPSITILPGNFSGIFFLQWAFFIDKSFIWVGNFSLFN